jgi:hypothetical protein
MATPVKMTLLFSLLLLLLRGLAQVGIQATLS